MMWGFDGGWGWWPMMFGGLLMVAFWVGVGILVIWAIVRLIQGPPRPAASAAPPPPPATATPSRETPLDVVKMRYARGEITKEQYDQLVKDLS